jgi:hypothetical protein
MGDKKAESVYSLLSKIVNLKFYSELKDSGIEFERIYRMTNLSTGKENYLIVVNNVEIRFVTQRDFIHHFSNFLTHNIVVLNKRYNELTSIVINDYTDDVALEMKYKEIDCFRFKQTELLGKLNQYWKNLSDN